MTPLWRFVSAVLTRSLCWVPNSANVPRLGVAPSLLLYFAASDTQRMLLAAAGVFSLGSGLGHQGVDGYKLLKGVR